MTEVLKKNLLPVNTVCLLHQQTGAADTSVVVTDVDKHHLLFLKHAVGRCMLLNVHSLTPGVSIRSEYVGIKWTSLELGMNALHVE